MPADDTPASGLVIETSFVRRMIATQFPEWADLPIRRIELEGWDNRSFRVGEDMSVRLPSAERYAGQVEKEQRWLPTLAPHLPLPIPAPIALGVPARGYPWRWSILRWLEGENATIERINDLCEFATALAGFLGALQRIDAAGGPPPGKHNFFRGGPLAIYDAETRATIESLHGQIETDAVTAVWQAALEAKWCGAPVWVHGDVSSTNLLVRGGHLAGVIDFGCLAVGDPASDMTIAWTFLSGQSRQAFCAALPLDDATWARGRGWALWKSLITLADHKNTNLEKADRARCVIDEVLADHGRRA